MRSARRGSQSGGRSSVFSSRLRRRFGELARRRRRTRGRHRSRTPRSPLAASLLGLFLRERDRNLVLEGTDGRLRRRQRLNRADGRKQRANVLLSRVNPHAHTHAHARFVFLVHGEGLLGRRRRSLLPLRPPNGRFQSGGFLRLDRRRLPRVHREKASQTPSRIFESGALAHGGPEPLGQVARHVVPQVPLIRQQDGAVVVSVSQAPAHSLVQRAKRLLRVPLVPREQPAGYALVVVQPLELHALVFDVWVRHPDDHHPPRVGIRKVDPLGNFTPNHRQQDRAASRVRLGRGRVRVRRRGDRRAHGPVVLREHRVERVLGPGGGFTPAASAAPPSAAAAPAPSPAGVGVRLLVTPGLLEHLLTRRLLQRLPRSGALPPLRDPVQQRIAREKHENAVRNVAAPLSQGVSEVVLVRKLGRRLERAVQTRARGTHAHRPRPHLLVNVHAVRRLHPNRKRNAELRREGVQRSQRPRG